MNQGDGDEVGAVVVAEPGAGPLDERVGPDCDVLVASRCPGLRVLAGGERIARSRWDRRAASSSFHRVIGGTFCVTR